MQGDWVVAFRLQLDDGPGPDWQKIIQIEMQEKAENNPNLRSHLNAWNSHFRIFEESARSDFTRIESNRVELRRVE